MIFIEKNLIDKLKDLATQLKILEDLLWKNKLTNIIMQMIIANRLKLKKSNKQKIIRTVKGMKILLKRKKQITQNKKMKNKL